MKSNQLVSNHNEGSTEVAEQMDEISLNDDVKTPESIKQVHPNVIDDFPPPSDYENDLDSPFASSTIQSQSSLLDVDFGEPFQSESQENRNELLQSSESVPDFFTTDFSTTQKPTHVPSSSEHNDSNRPHSPIDDDFNELGISTSPSPLNQDEEDESDSEFSFTPTHHNNDLIVSH